MLANFGAWNRRQLLMKNRFAVALAGALMLAALVPASAASHINERDHIRHVLLISVDGLHALDVANFVQSHPNSALAELSSHALTYSNARTPSLSDSFPGLLALVTGGSPVSHGLFYDVSYDRAIFDPTNTTCSGSPGNTMVFDESIDLYNSSNVSLNVIDPTNCRVSWTPMVTACRCFHTARCGPTLFSRWSRPRADKRPGQTSILLTIW